MVFPCPGFYVKAVRLIVVKITTIPVGNAVPVVPLNYDLSGASRQLPLSKGSETAAAGLPLSQPCG
jgi:hypothetical protein